MTVNLPTYNISMITACTFIGKIWRHPTVSVTMLSVFLGRIHKCNIQGQ